MTPGSSVDVPEAQATCYEAAPCPEQCRKVTPEALLLEGRTEARQVQLPVLMEPPPPPCLISSAQLIDGAGMVSHMQITSRRKF